MSKWIEYAGNIWLLIFAAYFVACIVVGIIEQIRRKKRQDTFAMSPGTFVLVVLHTALFLPIALSFWAVGWVFARILTIPLYLIFGAAWLWHRMIGKPKSRGAQD
jgi:hypothetical protein